VDIEIGEDVRPELQEKKSDKGFTLIELLIVIVILGVLSTVVVLSVGGITDKGKSSSCTSDYNALATAVESFDAQTGAFPADQTALVAGGYLRTKSLKYDVVPAGTVGSRPGDIDPIVAGGCKYDPDDGKTDNT
jgi:prepilin-type N-terminal cleavage/methylation domain-containing protein